MHEFEPKIDAAYHEFAELQLRRHFRLLTEKDESDEISAAEDRMELLWEKFDPIQRQSLNGLGADLNWVRRKFQPPPKGRQKPSDVPAIECQELEAAIKVQDWHRILHFLRLCAPAYRVASIARERGIAYAAIGLSNYAKVFNLQSLEFDNSNSTASVLLPI